MRLLKERSLKNKTGFVIPCHQYILNLEEKTCLMGVLNITPDSFSDGGLYLDIDRAIFCAKKMVADGADIIDIGGESSRPGSDPVSIDEESKRIIPVLKRLKKEIKVPISVDTYKSEIAEMALGEGADIINDITALRYDSRMAELIAKHNVPVIIMHMQGNPKCMQKKPHYKSLISEIIGYLKESINIAIRAGLDEHKIIIDPGIGFGKTTAHNVEIIRNLNEFKSLGKPILIGTSRKSFIGNVLDKAVDKRIYGTAASVAASVLNGANIVRVHDIAEMKQVVKIIDAINHRIEER